MWLFLKLDPRYCPIPPKCSKSISHTVEKKKKSFTCDTSGIEVTAAVIQPETGHVTEAASFVADVILLQAAQWGVTGATFQQRTQLVHNQIDIL